MRKYLAVLLLISFFVLSGCDDSIYSGAEDVNTKEALIDEFDFRFIKDECSYITAYYDEKLNAGVKLNDNDLYMYISSILACSNFDVIKGLDSVLQTGGDDIYQTVAAIIGYQKLNANISDKLRDEYSKAVDICRDYRHDLAKDNLTLNTTNLTLCGLAGTVGTIINVGAMIVHGAGGASELLLSEPGMKMFGETVNEKVIGQGVLAFLKAENLFFEDLDGGLALAEEATGALGDLLNQDDFNKVISDLARDLRKDGAITEVSLINFVAKMLDIEIPDDIYPDLPNLPDIPLP